MSSAIPTIVAGNEGYFGIINEKNADEAASGNFCARGYECINDEQLYADVCALLDMKMEERSALGSYLRRFALEHNSIGRIARQTESFYKMAHGTISFDPVGACICGYYGYGNTGDDTLLERAVLRIKKSCKGYGICVLTHSAKRSRYRFGVVCYNRYNFFSVIRAVYRSRVLVFGGGTLFQDRTSLRSMLYYSGVACLGLLFRKRVELWGNGLSEPKYPLSRLLLCLILKRSAYVGVRDKPSFLISKRYGAQNVDLEGDLALTIKKDKCHSSPNTYEIIKGISRYAVFSLSARTNDTQYNRFKKRAREAMDKGISVVTVAMYPKQDRKISKRFSKEVGGRYAEGLSASELVFILRNAEFCLSARLHLLIFARVAEIPFEAVGNDPKLVAFCKENGTPSLKDYDK
jgi:polysaccharide pyruvyl transferase CsaB